MKRRLRRQWKQFKAKSYYNSGSSRSGESHDRQNRNRTTQSKPRWRHSAKLFSVLLGLFLIGLMGFFSLSAPAQVDIDGLDGEVRAQIESKVDDYLGNGLNRFKLFIDEDKLVQFVSESVGVAIYDVTVENAYFGRTTKITGTLRQPRAYARLESGMVLYDQIGQAYTDESAALDRLPEIIDASPLSQVRTTTDADSQNLPASTVNFIHNLDTILKDKKLVKSGVKIKINDQPRSISWSPDNEPYDVLFLISRDPLDQVLEYESMRKYLKQKSITPRDYIDLRVNNTAYYR